MAQQNNAPATKQPNPLVVVRTELEKLEDQFAAALPAHIPVERFTRVVMTAVQNTPALLKCDRRSLWNAAMRAAQDGLLPDGRDGAIVEYKGVAQWMPMIGGIRKKVRNSGEIATWDVHAVYANDAFEFELGDDPFIKHKPALNDRGALIAVYSIAKLKSGEKSFDVMGIEDVDKIRKLSRAANGPWSNPTFYPEMAKKTVARRHSKVLPMSSDLDDLIRRDDNLYDLQAAGDQQNKPRLGLSERLTALAGPALDGSGDLIDGETGEVIEDDKPEKSSPEAQDGRKPADKEKPAAKAPAARQPAREPAQGNSDAPGASDAQEDEGGDGEETTVEFTAEQIDAAFDKGAEAKRDGRSRKATPPEWREPGFEPLINAWLDGFDRTVRAD